MNEALRSVLCDQPLWSFNPQFNEHIKFNNDGTGELWCILEMTYIFAVNFEWKLVSPKNVARTDEKTADRSPQCLGTLNLEITLQPSVANSFNGPLPTFPAPNQHSPNEHYLSKAAFKPRCFTVAIEKGNFIPDHMVGRTANARYNPQWGLRLVFDKSPYPAQEGLAHPTNSYDCSNRFDTMTTCVARELKHCEKTGRAMNDPLTVGVVIKTITTGDFIKPVRKALGLGHEELHICPECTPVFGAGIETDKEARRNCEWR